MTKGSVNIMEALQKLGECKITEISHQLARTLVGKGLSYNQAVELLELTKELLKDAII